MTPTPLEIWYSLRRRQQFGMVFLSMVCLVALSDISVNYKQSGIHIGLLAGAASTGFAVGAFVTGLLYIRIRKTPMTFDHAIPYAVGLIGFGLVVVEVFDWPYRPVGSEGRSLLKSSVQLGEMLGIQFFWIVIAVRHWKHIAKGDSKLPAASSTDY